MNDLIDNLESIHISPQMVLALDDPLLQRYAELDSNDEVKTQTDEWLSSFFDQQLNNIEEKKLKDVLLKALSYTRYTKVCWARNLNDRATKLMFLDTSRSRGGFLHTISLDMERGRKPKHYPKSFVLRRATIA